MFLIRRQKIKRSTILKGIYEDNMRIIGKYPSVPRWRIPPFVKGHFFFLCIMLLSIIGNARFLDSNAPTKQMKANLTPLPDNTSRPAEYLSLIGKKEIPIKQMFGLGVRTIVIDPGHGGSDPGTTGKLGLKEKDITLDIAKRLKEKLERHGKYNVLLTREGDETLPLTRRIEIANSNRADLFISIHVNYLPSRPINIIETYYFGPTSDSEALGLAAKENADSHYRLGEFKEVIEKIGDTLKLEESRKLASFIQQSLYLNIRARSGNVLDYGIKRAPFVVLLGVETAGVLAEVSCLSNRAEETKLYTSRYRDDIARYLESGILKYSEKGEPVYEATRGKQ